MEPPHEHYLEDNSTEEEVHSFFSKAKINIIRHLFSRGKTPSLVNTGIIRA